MNAPRIGDMRDWVQFLAPVVTQEPTYGQEIESPVAYLECFANVQTPEGAEYSLGDQRRGQRKRVIRIRYDDRVKNTDSVLHDGATYQVTAVHSPDNFHRWLIVECVEQTSGATAS